MGDEKTMSEQKTQKKSYNNKHDRQDTEEKTQRMTYIDKLKDKYFYEIITSLNIPEQYIGAAQYTKFKTVINSNPNYFRNVHKIHQKLNALERAILSICPMTIKPKVRRQKWKRTNNFGAASRMFCIINNETVANMKKWVQTGHNLELQYDSNTRFADNLACQVLQQGHDFCCWFGEFSTLWVYPSQVIFDINIYATNMCYFAQNVDKIVQILEDVSNMTMLNIFFSYYLYFAYIFGQRIPFRGTLGLIKHRESQFGSFGCCAIQPQATFTLFESEPETSIVSSVLVNRCVNCANSQL
ncbi:MAG: hypothetical protein GY928_37965 [Colwellia sp.]|nr:hypothetical protein [Colwellia sp.]